MTLTAHDRIEITDLINLHGHLVDAGRLHDVDDLVTPDVVYDVSDLGGGTLHGSAALRDAALALGDANPVAHHVTNIVITAAGEGSAQVRSKGLGIRADGSAGSVVYDDVVTRRPEGWRISRRTVTARRAALGRDAGPREVLERWRRAAVDRSVEEMRRVYAVDAVHEFPFRFPGVPGRLEGRDEIVDWIVAGWDAHPLTVRRYRTLALHDTADPETIVAEQEADGTSAAAGEVVLPAVVVLTARDGQLVHVRDYVDVGAAAASVGA